MSSSRRNFQKNLCRTHSVRALNSLANPLFVIWNQWLFPTLNPPLCSLVNTFNIIFTFLAVLFATLFKIRKSSTDSVEFCIVRAESACLDLANFIEEKAATIFTMTFVYCSTSIYFMPVFSPPPLPQDEQSQDKYSNLHLVACTAFDIFAVRYECQCLRNLVGGFRWQNKSN